MDNSNESGPADFTDYSRSALPHAAAFRQALVAKIGEYKAGVLDEFRNEPVAFLHFLRLAVNEAEGLAWSTPYAHWLLPALVEEKMQSVRQWASHQDWVSSQSSAAVCAYPG